MQVNNKIISSDDHNKPKLVVMKKCQNEKYLSLKHFTISAARMCSASFLFFVKVLRPKNSFVVEMCRCAFDGLKAVY